LLILLLPAADAQTIRLDPRNPHYFLFHGKTVALITSGEHYGAVMNADFDYRRYLATLEADGLNYTRLFGGSYVEVPARSFGIQRNDLAPAPGRFIAPWARSATPGYAGGGNKFDLDRWNPEYFERLRSFLAEADKRGSAVELTLFSSHYGELQWTYSPFNPANNVNGTDAIDWKKLNTPENGNILGYQERYARKLVHEASAFGNVIFEIANEPWSDRPVLTDVINPFLQAPGRDRYPNSVDLPDDLTMAWQGKVAQWISSDGGQHLIAQNYCNFRFPVKQLLPGVSVVNFHYAYPEAVSLNYGLVKAIAYDETGFLGQDDDKYTRQAWNFMLSGGGVFDGLDYSFSPGHEDGSDTAPNGPGGGSAEFRRRLHILSDFLRDLPLADLTPDIQTLVHAQGVYVRALSNAAHGDYAMYLDGNGPTSLSLQLPAGEYSVRFIDVRTGKTSLEDRFVHAGGVKIVMSPPFHSGVALRIRRKP
jgi:hypothetical protein